MPVGPAAHIPQVAALTDENYRMLIEMAEKRPTTLEDMAHVAGVGAKKLASYGQTFLTVITGTEARPVHPARLRIAGTAGAPLFDRLHAAQASLSRGEDGAGKFMSLGAPVLRRISEARPSSDRDLSRFLDPGQIERFGPSFLAILTET